VSPALYLIDTSGLFRILQSDLRKAWADQLAASVIAICPIVELGIYERAEEIQQLLTEAGMHRSAGPIDLLIAATAERARLTVLCDDRDYRTVSTITGQAVKFVTDI
jgi:predicted nucleic acid-binding protein